MSAPKVGLILVVLLGVGVVSPGGVGTPAPAVAVAAADQGIGRKVGMQDTESHVLNPHSDLIFRATGATSCRDCHLEHSRTVLAISEIPC
jgi:hypothetical protein